MVTDHKQLLREVTSQAGIEPRAPFDCWREPVDLKALLSGDGPPQPIPEMLRRSDGEHLLYRGKINEIHGEPESGKGFVAGALAAEDLVAGSTVAHLDFDVDPNGVVVRAIAGGATAEQCVEGLYVFSITEPLPLKRNGELEDEGVTTLREIAEIPGLSLVVLDGVNRAIEMHGRSPNEDRDVSWFYRVIVNPLRGSDRTTFSIDHVVKDRERRGTWASGSQQKRAALDGVSYETRVKVQPAPGRVGKVQLVVAKDRHGGVRQRSKRIGSTDFATTVMIDGQVDPPSVSFAAPDDGGIAGDWKPTVLMERISRWLEPQIDGRSQKAILDGVPGHVPSKKTAISELVAGEYVRVDVNGQTYLHTSMKPYREPKNSA